MAETLEIRTEKNAAEILLDGHPISDVLSYDLREDTKGAVLTICVEITGNVTVNL